MDGRSLGHRALSSVCIAAALVLAAVPIARAQERRVFEWSGRVEHDVELTISGRAFVTTRIGTNERAPRGRAEVVDVPRTSGELSIKVVEGRGEAEVVQQPAIENGYTAVIRVRDPERGGGNYRLNAYWQAVAAGDVAPIAAPYESPNATPSERDRIRAREVNRIALMWSGDVDSELEIVIQPSGVTYNTVRGSPPRALQSAISQMPWQGAYLEINQIVGRGEASIAQQPTAENGFTAKVRVRDPQLGFGHYAFMAVWR